ncbi:ribose-phosphate pyrophosphokinase 2 [Eurytemora carolleeae]|uniref:ribose-phosphate pyrophosphokinase 2 n=1 Tax=Eurytemora carolleeae TaxID=1294199 RepID=UPI000C76CA7C|nr:ribose-phosphate pyrophosphokinase 2 [Eurytemora carolleeae]|eukprot:XP_023337861.1 ribose-phosphate pyrophosphokinase 2-like [Eurytemora affinis]
MSKYFRRGSRSSMVVLGGSSHPELTAQIARKVGVKTGRVQLGKFKNNETQVELYDNVRDRDIYIIQTGGVNSNDAIIELLLIINSCKLASAATITVITPYYPYSKGDQKSSLRSPITSKLLANMLQNAGAEHIMMLDPHSPQLVGFFDLPVDSLKVEPLFCTWIKNHIPNWKNCIVVAPDEGGAKRSVMIANFLELEFAMIHNRYKNSLQTRKISNGESSKSTSPTRSSSSPDLEDATDSIVHLSGIEPPENLQLTPVMVDRLLKISGEVKGFDCILVDDMIDTGATIRLALEVLQSHGAGRVYVFAAHGLFSGDAKDILCEADNLDKVIVTNSVPQTKNKEIMGSILDVVDISGLISEYIRRCHYNESVSVLTDVGTEFDTKDEFLRSVVAAGRAEAGAKDGRVNNQRNRPLGRVKRGYRLESVCWDDAI